MCLCVNGKLLNLLSPCPSVRPCVYLCMCCSSVVSLDRARDPMHARVLSRFRSFLHFTTITIATATTTTITKKMRHFFRFSPISLYNLKQYILYKCLYSLGAHSSTLSLSFSLSLWSPKLPLPACTPHPPKPEPSRKERTSSRETKGKRKRKKR